MQKISLAYLYRKHLLGITAANGKFYVVDCFPWAIKQGCHHADCPMRSLAIPPIAGTDDYLLECEPVGILAGLLKLLRTAQTYTEKGNDTTR